MRQCSKSFETRSQSSACARIILKLEGGVTSPAKAGEKGRFAKRWKGECGSRPFGKRRELALPMIRRVMLSCLATALVFVGFYLLLLNVKCFFNFRLDCIYVTLRAGSIGVFLAALGIYLLLDEWAPHALSKIFPPGQNRQRIRIVRAPMGEAPLWVRQAWIGLDLPVAGKPFPKTGHTFGVLTGPKSFLRSIALMILFRSKRVRGYRVLVRDALGILGETRPDAVEWWRENAQHLLRPRVMFLFDDASCELVPK